MEDKTLTGKDGETIAYSVAGAGRPMVLLHGFTMYSGMWVTNGVVQDLAGEARLIVPDTRGHGASAKPRDPARYGLNLIDDLVAILAAEGVESADFVGYSMGAELSLKLAVTHPSLVSSLVIIGSGWSGEDDIPFYREYVAWARETGQAMTPDPDFDALDALVDAQLSIIDLTKEDLEGIRMPCAGIVGSDDPELANMESMKGIVPGFTLEVLPNVLHETSWIDPALPNLIRDFTRRS